MDKKIRMAFSGFLHGKRRAENAGEKPAIYTAPEVEICAYAPEKGFALSGTTKTKSNPMDDTQDVGRYENGENYEVGENYEGSWLNQF